jgi:hypothetical protein
MARRNSALSSRASGEHVPLDRHLRAGLVEHELEELDGLAHLLRHRA